VNIRFSKLHRQRGVSIVELAVAIGLIGLITISVIVSSLGPAKVERFSGDVKEFTNRLREAQTKSYTVDVGSCGTPGTCYWRGNVMEFSVGGTSYSRNRLYANASGDLSLAAGNLNPTVGITNWESDVNYSLNGIEIHMQIPARGDKSVLPSDPTFVALAFLAPQGRAYYCTANCDPRINPSPYTQNTQKIQFTLIDPGTNLTGIVTFDPVSGTINSKVE
jgi:hypothetical protein